MEVYKYYLDNNKMGGKKALILDLDETLIHSVVVPEENENLKRESDFHFQLDKNHYYVFKRPGLDKFLETAFDKFDYIGIWTTGMASYAKQILKHILTPEQVKHKRLVFIYTRNRCSHDDQGYYKPLDTVWKTYKKFTPRNTIMIDNTEAVMRKNLENGIVCPNFETDRSDCYLLWLDDHIRRNLDKVNPKQFTKAINALTV